MSRVALYNDAKPTGTTLIIMKIQTRAKEHGENIQKDLPPWYVFLRTSTKINTLKYVQKKKKQHYNF